VEEACVAFVPYVADTVVAGLMPRCAGQLVVALQTVQTEVLPTNLLLGIMVAVAALCAVLLFLRVSPRNGSDQGLLAADPTLSPSTLRGYALALTDAQRFAEAEDTIRVHLTRMPSDPRMRGVLAALYSLRGEHMAAAELQRASQVLQREYESMPPYIQQFAALLAVAQAVELESLGNSADAAARMHEATALDPAASTLRGSCMRQIVEAARDSELERYTFEALSGWGTERAGARALGFADATAAVRFYRHALAARPQDGRLLGDYAQALQATGDYRAAERTFKQALQQSPRDAWIHDDLGMFYWRLDRQADATRELQQAAQLSPKNAAVHATLAMLLRQGGHLQDAEQEMLTAVNLRPDVWILMRLVGEIMLAQGKLPQAARAYQEATRLGASDSDFRLDYAEILLRLDRAPAAEEQYRLAIRADSTNGAAYARYGAFLLRQLRIEDAEEQLRHALLLPGGEPAHVALAGLRLMERRLDEVPPELKAAMDAGIQTPEVQQYQAEWMLLRGRAPEAYAVAQRLVEQGPPRASVYLLLGGSLLSMDRQLEAQAALREAVRIDPGLPQRLLQQGRALRARGEVAAALETIAQALAVSPDWPEARAEHQTLLQEQATAPAAPRRFTYRSRS
jgi:tetratricopeptide (TPR) repeat protein